MKRKIYLFFGAIVAFVMITNLYSGITGGYAFSMLGDSRTEWVKMTKTGNQGEWHDSAILGKYRKSCAGQNDRIQNLGMAGSKASQWKAFCAAGSHNCSSDKLNKSDRVVLMIGGNDVIARTEEWRALTSDENRQKRMNQVLDSIHSDVKNIVAQLRQKGKEVIIQEHFKVNPGLIDTNFDDRERTWNEGLMGLRQRLEKDFGTQLVVVNPGYWKITGWKSVCGTVGWCPFCFRGCVPVASTEWVLPTVAWQDPVPDVSLAYLPKDFPAAYYLDDKHLNQAGYQYQASFVKDELRDRCWW